MLLANGENDCGDVGQALAALKDSGVIFRAVDITTGSRTPATAAAASRPGAGRFSAWHGR